MITTLTRFSLLLCACLTSAVNLSAQEILTPIELAGTYVAGHNFGGSSIDIQADGTYSEVSGACTMSVKQAGKYSLSGGTVHFTVLKYTGVQFSDQSKEINLFNLKARRKFFGYSDDEKVEPLRTEFSLLPVKWGERLYLIDEGDLRRFCNAINLGLEPRSGLISDPYYGSFFLRESDLEKSTAGEPKLPAEWLPFLVSESLTATIIAIETQDKTQIATIDRGSHDGLKVGMKLLGKEQEQFLWSRVGEVLSVELTTAKVQVDDLKIGDKLSSRYGASGPRFR